MSGVVLAGGASRRMGADKASLPHPTCPCRGTLLDHAVHVLADAGAAPVVAATGTAGRLGPHLPHDEVDDGEEHRGAGPLAGILAALRRSPVPVVAVLAVDLPSADAGLLRSLRRQWRHDDRALVPLDATGRPQPLHALWSTRVAPTIDDGLRRGERRVLHVLERSGARFLTPTESTSDWAANHNGPRLE